MPDETVRLSGLAYPVIVGEDGAAQAARALNEQSCSRAFLVYDRRVRRRAERYARALRAAQIEILAMLALTAGETLKTYTAVERMHRRMVRCGVDRRTAVVALGGGSVTDMAGFAASVYMRGVPWLAVATTLLGMVDAAIGGKTAINLKEGKNLVGAFWDPIAAIADLPSLATLGHAERRAGTAEMVKAAIVGDRALFEELRSLPKSVRGSRWRAAIAAAARVKVAVVARDPRELGPRAVLNLGHTVAHGLEAAARFRTAHGDAVALGLRAEGLISLWRGLWSAADHARMIGILRRHDLPVRTGRIDANVVIAAMRSDKKRSGGIQRLALPVRVGEVRAAVEVSESEIRRALQWCARPPAGDWSRP